jgi:hypothetical protein
MKLEEEYVKKVVHKQTQGETITITWLIETRHLHAYNYRIGITIWISWKSL